MKNNLVIVMLLMASLSSVSQNNNFWNKVVPSKKIKSRNIIDKKLPINNIFSLDIESLRKALTKAPLRRITSKSSDLIISFPDAKGVFENYRIFEASVLHPELAAKYPNIKSYAGINVEDSGDRIRFSISPKGLQSMRLGVDKATVFIERYSQKEHIYSVFTKSDKPKSFTGFNCTTEPKINKKSTKTVDLKRNANDGILRVYRIAISTTGEYTKYHGGTKEGALAAINATMTRVNGIFETEFNVTMEIIANTDAVIYTDMNNDPYSADLNTETQITLTGVIGESNYDIGHLFHMAYQNGQAYVASVCVDGKKGGSYSCHQIPEGDVFDVDYVAHEIGHQFGGTHTFTFDEEYPSNVQMEPGSGSTIMGYAGITLDTDIQSHSDSYFHAASIEQITNYIKSTSCQTDINTGNSAPEVSAGVNYIIPKGTPFVLTGMASDANASDVLSYCWEQIDENGAAHTFPDASKTSGVAFRSYAPTRKPYRYFPHMDIIKKGETQSTWEVIPNVNRELNFRLTVRDNRIGGGANNSDDMKITVNADAGPFKVTSPNTELSYPAGSEQVIRWSVAGTTSNGINAKSVDILLSTDGGETYPIVLANGVLNDGSCKVLIPNLLGAKNRVMVKGSDHVFFDISNRNFSIIESTAKPKGNCISLDFNEHEINSFSNQDKIGNFSLTPEGNAITLKDNTWKYINYPYTITPNTVIEFEFDSTSEGEIHGIGFENDNGLTPNKYFKIFGRQNFGVTNFNNFAQGTKTYAIPVGDSYTGKVDKIVFINDNDEGSGNNSTFSNIKIYEKSCLESKFKGNIIFGSRIDILGDEYEEGLTFLNIAPNPIKKGSSLKILSTTNKDLSNFSFIVNDMLGRILIEGILDKGRVTNLEKDKAEVNIEKLNSGVYIIRLENGNLNVVKRFIVE
ncbi:reprolysin-like metallopeptidase [Tenacibaculum sp. C7A-26P2]|uniref:zinc-dependent metalloprotease n=1 Tax=Tenacibaculum sp. C7A-26P2 TaxID=3447504 RepID=UPI003F8432EB